MNREKIGEMLKEYHPEYNEDTENYSYAEKGMQRVWEVSGYEEERKETTVSGARGTDSTSEVRTIAKRTKQLFLEQGVMNFIGTTISSPQDLAEMAQIYRNPNFEVFHIFYIKNTMLIGMEAVTSRLPFLISLKEYTSLLIYCENKGRVCEIEEVTNGFIRGPECKKHLKQHLYGGLVAKAYLYTDDERLFFDRIELIREGYVEDLVCKTERGHISAIGNRHRKDANILLAGETEDDLRNIVKGEFFTVERKRVKRRSR